MTIKALARETGIPYRKLLDAFREGQLSAHAMGAHGGPPYYVSVSAFQTWLESQQAHPAPREHIATVTRSVPSTASPAARERAARARAAEEFRIPTARRP
jgi:hypothetical protein